METIKEHLLNATSIAMDKREMEMHCGNALVEIIRLETLIEKLRCALDDIASGEIGINSCVKLAQKVLNITPKAPNDDALIKTISVEL